MHGKTKLLFFFFFSAIIAEMNRKLNVCLRILCLACLTSFCIFWHGKSSQSSYPEMPQPDKDRDVAVRAPQQYLAGLTGAQKSEKDVSTNIEKEKCSKMRCKRTQRNIAVVE